MLGSALGRRRKTTARKPERPAKVTAEAVRGRPAAMATPFAAALERHLIHLEPRRVGTEAIHVSALYALCTKEHVLSQERQAREVVKAGDRVRWDIGLAIQDLVRDKYLGPLGLISGDWRCLRCQHVTAHGMMPLQCPRCGGPREALTYHERQVTHDRLGIVGHPDGFEPDEERGEGVLEIKSMEGAVFDRLTAPLAPHVFQAQAYAWLTGKRWVRLLYVSTALQRGGFRTKTPFKDFRLPFDLRVPQQIEAKLADLGRGGGRACKSASDARAIACPVRRACWGL